MGRTEKGRIMPINFDPAAMFTTQIELLNGSIMYQQAMLNKETLDRIMPRQMKFQEDSLLDMQDSLEISRLEKAKANLEKLKAKKASDQAFCDKCDLKIAEIEDKLIEKYIESAGFREDV